MGFCGHFRAGNSTFSTENRHTPPLHLYYNASLWEIAIGLFKFYKKLFYFLSEITIFLLEIINSYHRSCNNLLIFSCIFHFFYSLPFVDSGRNHPTGTDIPRPFPTAPHRFPHPGIFPAPPTTKKPPPRGAFHKAGFTCRKTKRSTDDCSYSFLHVLPCKVWCVTPFKCTFRR